MSINFLISSKHIFRGVVTYYIDSTHSFGHWQSINYREIEVKLKTLVRIVSVK